VLVTARFLAWNRYLAALQRGAPQQSLEIISAFRQWFLMFGSLLPAALIVCGYLLPTVQPLLVALAGASATAAGWVMKFTLVARAAYNQGFALKHTPVRGVGAPGGAVKPGWSAS
jgi:phenylacetyl-CoA:acceptor oxidoreductase subunit 2